jgi:subtilase family serine protease
MRQRAFATFWPIFGAVSFALSSAAAQAAVGPKPVITAPVDETQLVILKGNTPPAALDSRNDRGVVDDSLRLDHLLLKLKRAPDTEARLEALIETMHNPDSPEYHHWLTAVQLGERYGLAARDLATIRLWLESHGFVVNRVYQNGLIVDFSGSAGQVREAFHTEIHNLVLPHGEQHLANIRDPQIPAALAPAVEGVASLHDFFPRPHSIQLGTVSRDPFTGEWHPHFTVSLFGSIYHVVSPWDFATIYNLIPLWERGFTGTGVTIATVEDSDLAHPRDWSDFRRTFGLDRFTGGNFQQVYPDCTDPGANGDEVEADLDVQWASATAPDANVELSACANSKTTSGLDLAILNLLETAPPDVISDSYGLCETITGQTEVALENSEAQQAVAEGVTFFIAQGDTGADECAPVEHTPYSTLGINSGDNTASAYAVDVGGTDFMAQYNADVNGVPLSNYWSATNNPQTLASALSYIPEIPWNDSCASQLIFSDPKNGGFAESWGASGFCNSTLGHQSFLNYYGGSGGPSTCFTGEPSIPGVVSGTCQGNPKPSYQTGVPGIPNDGLRDQPDLAFFASDGSVWGSFLVECFSDRKEGGTPCSAKGDVLEGGGGTSFAAPAMAGIQALIDQKYGKQGNANYVFYALAAQQFQNPNAGAACDASQTTGGLPATTCIFNDIQLGDMDIPCGQNRDGSYYNCFGAASPLIGELSSSNSTAEPAYPATVGYDLATGLGSVNATNLFDSWPTSAQGSPSEKK